MPINATTNISYSELTVAIARERKETHGTEYAKPNAPRSPMPELTSNKHPNRSILTWLRNRNKCNQFVGDVLTLAGLAMPTFRMRDGSKHFVNAEALPAQTDYFERRIRAADIAPGDLLVVDSPGRGENTAHVEIVSSVQVKEPVQLSTIGAIPTGVAETDRSTLLRDGSWSDRGFLRRGATKSFFLRPRLALPQNR